MLVTPTFTGMRDIFDQPGSAKACAFNNNKSENDKGKDAGQKKYFFQNPQRLIGN